MCESNAYVVDMDGKEELLMENVEYLRPDGNGLFLRSMFGEEKTVHAKIREMDLTSHRILLEYL